MAAEGQCEHAQRITPHLGAQMVGGLVTRIAIEALAAVQFIAMNGCGALTCHLIITGSAIVSDVVDVGDVGDVRRLMNDLEVLPLIDEHRVQKR